MIKQNLTVSDTKEPESVVVYPGLSIVMYTLQRTKTVGRLMCFNPCSFGSSVLELCDWFITPESGQEAGSNWEWTATAPTTMQL